MKKGLVLLSIAALAGVAQAEDWNNPHNRNPKQQPAAAATTTTTRSFKSNNAVHTNTTAHGTAFNPTTARTLRSTQFNTTNTVNTSNTARYHNRNVNTTGTLNTTNTARAFNTTKPLNTAHSQRFNTVNNAHITNNNNVTVNRFRQFNITNAHPNAPRIAFRAGNRIVGASNWSGPQYAAFRNYSAVWHDQSWWRAHHTRIVFVLGGWYYWNSGWWYPAYGYDPYAVYYWDGPIYGYNDLPPDQVVANVQAALQAQGYYHGEIDGVLGPMTRAAIASFQEQQGLLVTSAIDQPTLSALGYS